MRLTPILPSEELMTSVNNHILSVNTYTGMCEFMLPVNINYRLNMSLALSFMRKPFIKFTTSLENKNFTYIRGCVKQDYVDYFRSKLDQLKQENIKLIIDAKKKH